MRRRDRSWSFYHGRRVWHRTGLMQGNPRLLAGLESGQQTLCENLEVSTLFVGCKCLDQRADFGAIGFDQRIEGGDPCHHDDSVTNAHVFAGGQTILESSLEAVLPLAEDDSELFPREKVSCRNLFTTVAVMPPHLEAGQLLSNRLFGIRFGLTMPWGEVG